MPNKLGLVITIYPPCVLLTLLSQSVQTELVVKMMNSQ